MPDDEFGLLVYGFAKKRRTEVRISINEYQGHRYIDIREFYLTEEGVFKPSGKGVTIPPHLIGELVQGVALLAESLEYSLDSSDEANDPQVAD